MTRQTAIESAETLAALRAAATAETRLAAARPTFSALSNRKLAAAGFEMPAWQDALQRWLAARGRAPRAEAGTAI